MHVNDHKIKIWGLENVYIYIILCS